MIRGGHMTGGPLMEFCAQVRGAGKSYGRLEKRRARGGSHTIQTPPAAEPGV